MTITTRRASYEDARHLGLRIEVALIEVALIEVVPVKGPSYPTGA